MEKKKRFTDSAAFRKAKHFFPTPDFGDSEICFILTNLDNSQNRNLFIQFCLENLYFLFSPKILFLYSKKHDDKDAYIKVIRIQKNSLLFPLILH